MPANPGFENGAECDQSADTREPAQNKKIKASITALQIEEGTTKNESQERDSWDSGTQFLMSCIAMSVGLGNVWRFPFTAYENGGGAFLVPYLIVLVLVGRPLYYLEMCIGQFCNKGAVKSFESLAPILKGVGYGQLFAMVCLTTYYCSLLAITLYYLFNSFTTDLPWAHCKDEWENEMVHCVSSKAVNISNATLGNSVTSSELWFTKEVLKEKSNIDDGIGLPDWKLSAFLFVSWFLSFVIAAKGIKSSGKASYVLALFPYVIMFALLIRAVTLEGSAKGIVYFLTPQWEKLLDAKVWYNAITQCYFSLNVGTGAIIMFSSYNKFHYNVYRDALIVTSLDTFTSLLSGITTFGILGNLAHLLGVEVNQVISAGGTRLAFVSYPDAITKFAVVPWVFAILFFVMLFVLGIGSLVAGQNSAHTAVKDAFPWIKHWYISFGICCVGFISGLVYVTPGGQFVLTLVDYFATTFVLFVLTTVEVAVFFWWYGLENLCIDIEFMLKRKMTIYWRLCWGIFTPFILISILIYFVCTLQRLTNGIYPFPDRALNVGWCLFAFGVSQPLIWWMIYLFRKRQMGLKLAVLESVSFKNWHPKDPKIYEDWKKFRAAKMEERERKQLSSVQRAFYFLIGK